ncbi:MAG: IS5 family transposase [Melioribacteraceae bacterium]|nr:IS5 family transposase [Melioribacteraceae bacterium]
MFKNRAFFIRKKVILHYKSENQIELFEFEHPFGGKLDPTNRWVKLSKILPWEELISIYGKSLSTSKGRYGIDGRLAVGSLIIKHRLGLSDREVISMIQENIYLQYFLGFHSFKKEPAFDSSLFVHLRKRLGSVAFDEMTQLIISASERIKNKKNTKTSSDNVSTDKTDGHHKKKPNKGKLKIDATVADQMIEYPTDHSLLNNAREKSEKIIDTLYKQTDLRQKPRTYRRNARKAYLSFSKMKKRSRKQIRKAVGKQLRYLSRNIGHIHKLLDIFDEKEFPLSKKEQKIFWIIQELYRQQEEMYREHKHSTKDRIVNIHQPYVRPIPRGKAKSQTEFGAKIGVSLVEGFSRITTLSWDAYSESKDLEKQVEDYNTLYGCYPEVVLADKAYLTRENRKYLRELEIRVTGAPIGRPKKEESYYEKAKKRKENNQRNHIEGKFGQAKNAYGLSKIRARRQDTSESWIASIFFVMNLVKFLHLFYALKKKAYYSFIESFLLNQIILKLRFKIILL